MLRNSLFTIHFSPSSSKSVGSPSFVFQATICHGAREPEEDRSLQKPIFFPWPLLSSSNQKPSWPGDPLPRRRPTSLPAYPSGPIQGAPSGGLQDHLWAAPCLLGSPPPSHSIQGQIGPRFRR